MKAAPPLADVSLCVQVPAYLNDNPYVTVGYRKLATHWAALKSLWYFHCHSMDTWTSVATAVQSIILFMYSACLPTAQWQRGPSDRICLFLFFMMGIVHAPASVAYHLFGHAGISHEWFLFYQRLDFLMIFGGLVPLSLALAWYPWFHMPWLIGLAGLLAMCTMLTVLYYIKTDFTPLHRIQLIAFQVLPHPCVVVSA